MIEGTYTLQSYTTEGQTFNKSDGLTGSVTFTRVTDNHSRLHLVRTWYGQKTYDQTTNVYLSGQKGSQIVSIYNNSDRATSIGAASRGSVDLNIVYTDYTTVRVIAER